MSIIGRNYDINAGVFMVIVAPGYISKACLPYASDIFYHGELLYFLPTGFHDVEIQSVLGFPEYCMRNAIALPSIIWEMCSLYFENSKDAKDCLDIIEPLREKFIVVSSLIYPRNRIAIDNSTKLLKKHPQLYENFLDTDFNLKFVSRELLSHVLFEIFIEEGYKGAVQYFEEYTRNYNDFIHLIAAVVLNRLKIFASDSVELLTYEHGYYPLLNNLSIITSTDKKEASLNNDRYSFDVEHFRYKLFEKILEPIYGRCDTKSKSFSVAKTAISKSKEIDALKEACRQIALEVVILPVKDEKFRQMKLQDSIKKNITEPLGFLIGKPLKDIKSLLSDFVLDSTVISGLLCMVQKVDLNTFSLALTAGAVSTGLKYILKEESQHKVQPSDLLVSGINKMKLEYKEIENYLNSISIEQLSIPMNLREKK